MKTILSTYVYAILLIIVSSCSGNNSTKNDSNTFKNFFDTGELKSSEVYDIDRTNREGKSIYYFRNGNIKLEGSYKNDLKEGLFKGYYEDTGDLKAKLYYKNGMKHGVSRWYYNDNEKLETEMTFSDDKPDGISKSYYENGSIGDSSYYMNGVRQGNRILHHKNGELKMYLFYDNDGRMTYKRQYTSNGNFMNHFGLYFTDIIVDDEFYNIGDTFTAELSIAIPPKLDYNLLCYEKESNSLNSNKRIVQLVDNKFLYQKVLKNSNVISLYFELNIDSKNDNDRKREIFEIIVNPDGVTSLVVKRDSLAELEVRQQIDGNVVN